MWFFDVQRGVVAMTDIDGVSRILATSDGGHMWTTTYLAPPTLRMSASTTPSLALGIQLPRDRVT
jgi:hypothetical protein